jgi:hypothetical protein
MCRNLNYIRINGPGFRVGSDSSAEDGKETGVNQPGDRSGNGCSRPLNSGSDQICSRSVAEQGLGGLGDIGPRLLMPASLACSALGDGGFEQSRVSFPLASYMLPQYTNARMTDMSPACDM